MKGSSLVVRRALWKFHSYLGRTEPFEERHKRDGVREGATQDNSALFSGG